MYLSNTIGLVLENNFSCPALPGDVLWLGGVKPPALSPAHISTLRFFLTEITGYFLLSGNPDGVGGAQQNAEECDIPRIYPEKAGGRQE